MWLTHQHLQNHRGRCSQLRCHVTPPVGSNSQMPTVNLEEKTIAWFAIVCTFVDHKSDVLSCYIAIMLFHFHIIFMKSFPLWIREHRQPQTAYDLLDLHSLPLEVQPAALAEQENLRCCFQTCRREITGGDTVGGYEGLKLSQAFWK